MGGRRRVQNHSHECTLLCAASTAALLPFALQKGPLRCGVRPMAPCTSSETEALPIQIQTGRRGNSNVLSGHCVPPETFR